MTSSDVAGRLAATLGAQAVGEGPVGGGCVGDARVVRLAHPDGSVTTAFVKTVPGAPPAMFRREAEGLAWLAETGTVRVPQVLVARDHDAAGPGFLALEWIEAAPAAADHDERLGRALAGLHRAPCPGFGGPHDNYVGPLPQANAPAPTWAGFYGERRIGALTRRAVDGGHLPAAALADLDRVLARLPDLVGPPEPPSRLHGDLWAGNALTGPDGGPVLVDPAVYGGHREVDLAMMRLFGGFGPRVFAAYGEAHPLADGHEDRVQLHQLYPLLVHTVLFGGGYAGAALGALRRYR